MLSFGNILTLASTTSATRLTSDTIETNHFLIQAISANSNLVRVGFSSVSTTRYLVEILPGSSFEWIDHKGKLTPLNRIYILPVTANDQVVWIYEAEISLCR